MDSVDIETYTYQLKQVNEALKKDPANSELVSLKAELENLIDLTRQLLGSNAAGSSSAAPVAGPSAPKAKPAAAAAAASSSTAREKRPSYLDGASDAPSNKPLKAGDDCMARWTKDGKFYPARVTSVGGSTAQPVYGIQYHFDQTTELLPAGDVKQISDTKKRAIQADNAEKDAEKERKKKKMEKKEATKAEKDADMRGKQASWQTFAKKSGKKGVSIPGMSGTSMFKTPDDPMAKVGVVGAGRGMTDYKAKGRHIFE